MNGSLPRLATAFGEEAGPDLVVAVSRASDTSLGDFAEALLAAPPAPAPAPENQLRPIISARLGVVTTPRGPVAAPSRAVVDVFGAADPRFTGSGLFPNSVLRALLYCHGLALEDPLILAADMYLGASSERRPVARKFLEAAAASLVEIGPLLQTGVVETFFATSETRAWADHVENELAPIASGESRDEISRAFEALYVEGLSPKLQELWRVVRRGGEPSDELLHEAIASEPIEIVEPFIEIARDLPRSAVAETVFAALAQSLGAVRQLGGSHDLLVPAGVLELLLAAAPPAGVPLDWRRLQALSGIDVPNIEQLRVEDAVAIRQQSEAFELWRSRLSIGLDRARMVATEAGDYEDAARVIAETLADAQDRLLVECRDSPVLARERGLVRFVAGALGAAVGGLSGGAAGAALGAVGVAVTSVFTAAFAPANRVPAHIRRHYVVFDEARGGEH